MSFAPGTRLGFYEIVGPLGAGGMGEVYRARDSRLKREVALKVLHPDVASDRERLARFQREAEVLASLNHPNIAQVYGIEMTLAQQVSVFVVMLFTSKGAAGVTGGAFAALAATVIAAGLPAEGLALLLGVDRFMSLGRSVTNTIGNAVAAVVVAKWDGEFDRQAWAKATTVPFPTAK